MALPLIGPLLAGAKAFGGMGGAIKSLTKGVNVSAKAFSQNRFSLGMKSLEKGFSRGKPAVDMIVKAFEFLKAKAMKAAATTQAMLDVGGKFAASLGAAGALIKPFGEVVGIGAKLIKADMIGAITDFAGMIANSIGTFKELAAAAAPDGLKAFDQAQKALAALLGSQLLPVYTGFMAMIMTVTDVLANMMPPIEKVVEHFGSKILPHLEAAVQPIADMLVGGLTVAQSMLEVFAASLGPVATLMAQAAPMINTLVQELGGIFLESMKELGVMMNGIVIPAILSFTQTIGQMVVPTLEFLNASCMALYPVFDVLFTATSAVVDVFLRGLTPVLKLVGMLLNGLALGLKAIGSVFIEMIAGLADAVGWLLKKIWFTEAGENLEKGAKELRSRYGFEAVQKGMEETNEYGIRVPKQPRAKIPPAKEATEKVKEGMGKAIKVAAEETKRPADQAGKAGSYSSITDVRKQIQQASAKTVMEQKIIDQQAQANQILTQIAGSTRKLADNQKPMIGP